MKLVLPTLKAIGLGALVGVVLPAKIALGADAPGGLTMNTIIEGAKKEGKVYWGS